VKQELAKEGVLPFSRFFARNTTTPLARFHRFWRSRKGCDQQDVALEQSPAAALFLHWWFAAILIGATSMQKPTVAYSMLVQLYSYSLVIILGILVGGGLLYLKWHQRNDWTDNVSFTPWGGPTAAIIYR
jgi:hypothetical protein